MTILSSFLNDYCVCFPHLANGPWNELTVGLVIAVAVPLLISVIATATSGVLWNVPDSVNRYR